MFNMFSIIIFVVIVSFTEQGYADEGNARAEEALRKSLLQDYDKSARPMTKTTITLRSLTILNFEMHEAEHFIDLFSWIGLSWVDPRLHFSPDDHLGVKQLGMNPDSLWRPDLSIYTAARAESASMKSQMPMLVYAQGKILHVSVISFHSSCIMDLTYWPHDTHNCSIKLGSWIHSGHLMDIVLSNDFKIEIEIPSSNINGYNVSRTEWNITHTKAVREVKYYSCCEEPYVDIFISLLITREAPGFSWTIKLPAACISILTIVMFLLPPGAGEKLTFGGLCLLLDLLYINYTSSAVNHAQSHTPLIVQLVCQQLVLLMISVIVGAIVVRIARDPHSSGLPPILKGPVTGLAYILCLEGYANLSLGSYTTFTRTIKPDEVELGDECNGELRRKEIIDSGEWLMLGAVVDRLCLILYTAICIISLIRFSSVL